MSSIVDKAFDATQKIMRTIFRGTPNLFTTPDLNRQIEAFDYRLKQLEWFRGIETDADLEYNRGAGYYNIALVGTYIRLFGCMLVERSSRGTLAEINLYSLGDDWENIFLYVVPQVITYSDDPGHTISGAKFQDGTSRAAADNIQIVSWGLCCDNGYDGGRGTIYSRPKAPIVNDGTWGIVQDVPVGALLIPIISEHTDDGTVFYKHFYKDTNKVLLDLVNNHYPQGYSLTDDEGGHLLEVDDPTSTAGFSIDGTFISNGWVHQLEVRFYKSGYVASSGAWGLRSQTASWLAPFSGKSFPMSIMVLNETAGTVEIPSSASASGRVVYGEHPITGVTGYYIEVVAQVASSPTSGNRTLEVKGNFLALKTLSPWIPTDDL